MPIPGQMLHNRYQIQNQLGQGGMGAVYLARDTVLEHKVAVKEMRPSGDLSPDTLDGLRQQFQREARVLAGLNHPNLPRVIDYFTDGGNEYLVMDYIEGQSLDDVIRAHGRPGLPEAQVTNWARQLLDALEYIHARNVLHRDIKPANIRLTPDGRVVLVDFGLVKLYDPSRPQTVVVLRGAGTPQYAPPEQVDYTYGHTDARSDIFSLGATLYYLLTGQLPPSLTERLIKQTPIQPIRTHVPDVSPAVEAAIFKAIQLRPDDRFQSAAEMRAALTQPSAPTAAMPPTARPPLPPTYVSPAPQPTPQPAPRPTPQPTPQPVPPYVSSPPPVAAPRRGGLPPWAWLGGCGCLLVLVACLGLGGMGLIFGSGTPTPVALATPPELPTDTPVPPTKILYSNDFSDPTSGWAEHDEDDSAVGYADGKYFIAVKKDQFIVWETANKTLGDVSIEVEAVVKSGDADTEYGLICRHQDTDNFYALMIAGDGTAAIRKRQNGGDFTLLSGDEWQFSSAINLGQASNKFRAVCQGDHLTLYVNGVRVAEATDSSFAQGDVGLAAGTFGAAGVRVEFDDFTVQEP